MVLVTDAVPLESNLIGSGVVPALRSAASM